MRNEYVRLVEETVNEAKMSRQEWTEIEKEIKGLKPSTGGTKHNNIFIIVMKMKNGKHRVDTLTANDSKSAKKIFELMKKKILGGASTPKNYEYVALYEYTGGKKFQSPTEPFALAHKDINEKSGKLNPKNWKKLTDY